MIEVVCFMAITEARRKANEKYNAKAYDEIKVRVSKGRKSELQVYAEQRNESLNGFIGRAIDNQIAQDAAGIPSESPTAHFQAGGVILSPDALKAAQRASEATGETTGQFVERAVETQIKRDQLSLRMGSNPVTGEKLKKE
jgi:hypothetical protein